MVLFLQWNVYWSKVRLNISLTTSFFPKEDKFMTSSSKPVEECSNKLRIWPGSVDVMPLAVDPDVRVLQLSVHWTQVPEEGHLPIMHRQSHKVHLATARPCTKAQKHANKGQNHKWKSRANALTSMCINYIKWLNLSYKSEQQGSSHLKGNTTEQLTISNLEAVRIYESMKQGKKGTNTY